MLEKPARRGVGNRSCFLTYYQPLSRHSRQALGARRQALREIAVRSNLPEKKLRALFAVNFPIGQLPRPVASRDYGPAALALPETIYCAT